MSVKTTTTTVTVCDGCGFTIDRQPEEGWIRISSHWGNVIFGAVNGWIACSFECAAVVAEKVRHHRRRRGFGIVGEMGNLDSLAKSEEP